jgi:hypothetical protein
MKLFIHSICFLMTVFIVTPSNADAQLSQVEMHVHEGHMALHCGFCGSNISFLDTPKQIAADEAWFKSRQNAPSRALSSQNSHTFEIGDERAFIMNDQGARRAFILKDKTALHYVWVDKNRPNAVPDEVIHRLNEAILKSTPEGSVNSEQGFIANLHETLGLPTYFERDGMFHILFFDMPGLQLGGIAAPWYDDADVMWIDSRELLLEHPDLLHAVVAHEYGHLIHTPHLDISPLSWANLEHVLIAEAIANYAMIVNGYSYVMFSPEFLLYTDELNRSLFSWRNRNEHPTTFRRDYHRATLFLAYIASEFGVSAVRDIMQNSINVQGARNLIEVLAQYGSSLQETLAGFHLANFLNNQDLDPSYGYRDFKLDPEHGYSFPELDDIRLADHKSAYSLLVDGTETSATEEMLFIVQPGGVVYMAWEKVENLQLIIDVVAPEPVYEQRKGWVRLRIIEETFNSGGSIRVFDPWLSREDDRISIPGNFDRITVAVIHSLPETTPLRIKMASSWGVQALMLHRVSPAAAELRFHTVAGAQYRLRKSADLNTWSLFGDIIMGTGDEVSVPVALDDARAFFQLAGP